MVFTVYLSPIAQKLRDFAKLGWRMWEQLDWGWPLSKVFPTWCSFTGPSTPECSFICVLSKVFTLKGSSFQEKIGKFGSWVVHKMSTQFWARWEGVDFRAGHYSEFHWVWRCLWGQCKNIFVWKITLGKVEKGRLGLRRWAANLGKDLAAEQRAEVSCSQPYTDLPFAFV